MIEVGGTLYFSSPPRRARFASLLPITIATTATATLPPPATIFFPSVQSNGEHFRGGLSIDSPEYIRPHTWY